MVASGYTGLYRVCGVVAVPYGYSDGEKGLALQLGDAVADADNNRLVPSGIAGLENHRIQPGAGYSNGSLDRTQFSGSGTDRSRFYPHQTTLAENRPAGSFRGNNSVAGSPLYLRTDKHTVVRGADAGNVGGFPGTTLAGTPF